MNECKPLVGVYDAINRRDVTAALEFVDDDILYGGATTHLPHHVSDPSL